MPVGGSVLGGYHMRGRSCLFFVLLFSLLSLGEGMGQFPFEKEKKPKGEKGPASEEEEIAKDIRKAFESPLERQGKILKELRKAYLAPTPQQEEKVFREIRKAYQPTPDEEEHILRELRRAYQAPSAEQEGRIFDAITRSQPILPGTLAPDPKRGEGYFRKLDLNGDGLLNIDEMPEGLRAERARWDLNGDGFIDLGEYQMYFQGRVQSVILERGPELLQILGRSGPEFIPPPQEENPRPVVYRVGKLPPELPSWFQELDTDKDGQVGLYEWKTSGRPIKEFLSLDRNQDGFLTVEEVLRYIAQTKGQGARTGDVGVAGGGSWSSSFSFPSFGDGKADKKGKGDKKKDKGGKKGKNDW